MAALRAAARRPVHAYLLVGPPGTGKREAARSFAAAVLCPSGGDGTCDVCRRVLAGTHPDVTVVERDGPAITMDAAREITRLAARSPVEAERKVIVLPDFHLVRDAGPALLKTIEEPPASAVFVVLADAVPPELVTIASRCAPVDFRPLSVGDVADALVAAGVPSERAVAVAGAAGGRLDRARLLVDDPQLESRMETWRSVPSRLDGHGATAARLADQLVALIDGGVEPLRQRQQLEVEELQQRNARAAEVNGKVAGGKSASRPGVKELEDRHRREVRRYRTDELKAGLAVMAGAYRDRAAGGTPAAAEAAPPAGAGRGRADPRVAPALRALDLIQDLSENLAFNPGELLALQALLARLGRLGA